MKDQLSDVTLFLRKDDGWDAPRVKTKSFPRYASLQDYLGNKGLACNLNGTKLVYIVPLNCWDNLASSVAQVNITHVADITNATVQYDKSFEPYRVFVSKYCNSVNAILPPPSVNIGTRRLEVSLDGSGNVLTLINCRRLVELPVERTKELDIVSSICYQPLAYTSYPEKYIASTPGGMTSHIAPLFHDLRDLISVMWLVGNSLVDPVARARTVLLAGEGATGKSRVLLCIQECCEGSTSTVRVGGMTSTRKDVTAEIMSMAASSRFMFAYDVNLETGKLDLDIVKNVTGGDMINVGGNTARSQCSVFMGTNGVPNASDEEIYRSDAIMRRMVMIPMMTDAFAIGLEHAPVDEGSKLDFVCSCIHTRLTYSEVPISPRALVLTITMDMYPYVRDELWFYEDDVPHVDATEVEYRTVSSILAGALDKSESSVIYTCGLISRLGLFTYNGETYIRGVLPLSSMERYYSVNR